MHQVLGVRQHCMGRMTQKIDMPHPDQCRHGRQVVLQRRVAKVLVHLESAGEEFLEAFEADG